MDETIEMVSRKVYIPSKYKILLIRDRFRPINLLMK